MEVAAVGCYGNTGHRYWQLDRQHQMEWGVAGRERGGSHAVERRVLQLKARTRILKRRHRYRRRDVVEVGM